MPSLFSGFVHLLTRLANCFQSARFRASFVNLAISAETAMFFCASFPRVFGGPCVAMCTVSGNCANFVDFFWPPSVLAHCCFRSFLKCKCASRSSNACLGLEWCHLVDSLLLDRITVSLVVCARAKRKWSKISLRGLAPSRFSLIAANESLSADIITLCWVQKTVRSLS